MPGSRASEIKNNMKKLKYVISKSINKFSNYQFYILTFTENEPLIRNYVSNNQVKIITDIKKKHDIMKAAYLAVAASGSVTLELINYRIPTLVFYETHWLTKILIKLFVKVKYASIINIFYNREIISEFLFEKFTHDNVINKMKNLINNRVSRLEQKKYFDNFSRKMIINQRNPSEIIVKNLNI